MLSPTMLCAYAVVSCVHAHRQTFHCVCTMQNFCGGGEGGLESKPLTWSACTNSARCVGVYMCMYMYLNHSGIVQGMFFSHGDRKSVV